MNKIFSNSLLALVLMGIGTLSTSAEHMQYSSSDELPVIYGNVVSSTGNVTPSGIYSFSPDYDIVLSPVKIDDADLVGNRGAVRVGDKYEVVNMMSHYTYDINSWERIHECKLGWPTMMEMAAQSVAYDPVTNKTYGFFLTTTQTYRLATVDYDTNTVTEIKDYGGDMYAAVMFAATDGTLYGIMTNGDFVTFDKTTGESTIKGNVGIIPYGYQGAVCAPGGEVYWAAGTESGSGLYEVSLDDGSITLLAEFPNGEQMTGLYTVVPTLVDKDKPAPATDLEFIFPDGTLQGKMRFVIPDESATGLPLNGNVNYCVKFNDVEMISGMALAGSEVITDIIELDNAGQYLASVVLGNDFGDSAAAYLRGYLGLDTPERVRNVRLDVSGSTATVRWNVPAKGVNDGYMNGKDLLYDVTRFPGDVKVADGISSLEFSETLSSEQLCIYRYSIVARNGNFVSEPEYTDNFKLGNVVTPPYKEDFRDKASLELYTIIDNNNDGYTWAFNDVSQSLEYYANQADDKADDWLITPPLSLDKEKIYGISFSVTGSGELTTQDIAVAMGRDKTVKAMGTELLASSVINQGKRHIIRMFSVDEDGVYYIGFHTSTAAGYGWLTLADLEIDVVSSKDAPAAPCNFTVTAAPNGALSADVCLEAPRLTIDGDELSTIESIELYRDDAKIHTWNNPEPGQELKFYDEECQEGMRSYTATAISDKGAGYPAILEVFVGTDIPAAVENVALELVGDKVTLSWSPASRGFNGGYVDYEKVVYTIQRNDGEFVAIGISDLSFVDTPDKYDDQYELAYAIVAISEKGKSPLSVSPSLLFGDDYTLPYMESFANMQTSNYWGVRNSDYGSFMLTDRFSVDNDNGAVLYQGNGAGANAEIYSGRISIGMAEYPYLQFYTALNSGAVVLDIDVIEADGTRKKISEYNVETVGSIEQRTVSLAEFIGYEPIQVCFQCSSEQLGTMMFIDDIKIVDDYNLSTIEINDDTLGNIYSDRGMIVVECAYGKDVKVFAADGKCVYSGMSSGHDVIHVPAGIYMVVVGTRVSKLAVR